MSTTRIRKVRKHEAKRAHVTLPNPHIRESQLNKTGVTLTAREYRRVKASVERINRGEFVEYASVQDAIADLCGNAKN
ncbi:hypothetical protein AAG565_10080 [Fontimonas sp. SYSU GA230001]|uniref:hypothetical protein n=1 Tax=Fontimonas sp. SYSU GA230001 TaxID=3142450 RepID=UPI0032B5A86B